MALAAAPRRTFFLETVHGFYRERAASEGAMGCDDRLRHRPQRELRPTSGWPLTSMPSSSMARGTRRIQSFAGKGWAI